MELPSYDELPVTPGAPAGSSWGVWGEDDVLGCLNLLTPEAALRGARAVHDGTVFNLDLPVDTPSPPLFGRPAAIHEVTWLRGEAGHDDTLSINTQSSSQWDGFRHIRHPIHGYYGGVEDAEHGVHHWARKGIATRGVLADVARWRAAQGRPLRADAPDPIEAEDITSTLDAQGCVLEPGDVLLIRTGWLVWYRGLDAHARARYAEDHAICGLRPGVVMLRTLWDLHIAALGMDNPSVEVWPVGSASRPEAFEELRHDRNAITDIFLHTALLPLIGLPLGELFDLEGLADACHRDGRYTCLFTSSPLNVPGGVASPPNALAIR